MCCAKYGGPIATVRDDRKIVSVAGGATRPAVRVATASGRELASMLWTGGRIVAWGWSDDVELCVMDDSGEVRTAVSLVSPHLAITCTHTSM